MDRHEDLLAAALDAVTAVESQSADSKASEGRPVVIHKAAASDHPNRDVDNAPEDSASFPDALTNAEDDEYDLQFSISAFGNLMDDDDIDPCRDEDGSVRPDVAGADDADECVTQLRKQLDEAVQMRDNAANMVDELQNEIEQLRAARKQLCDRCTRISADFDNYRKRIARDQELVRNQAEERIVLDFLTVMDNLERAIVHATQADDGQRLLQGVEMIAKQYACVLAKHGCTPYESLGAEFDPVYHDVLQRVVDNEKTHNAVVQEHLRGYIMHDRVLRPALVVVAQHDDANAEENCDVRPDESANQGD